MPAFDAGTAGSAINPHSDAQHRPAIATGRPAADVDPASFLGPSTGTMQVNPQAGTSLTNFAYPEAVKNTSEQVRDDIVNLSTDMTWYTSVALPWAETDQMQIRWNEWHFDHPLAGRVPHEGVSRLIESSKSSFKTHVVRRGLAFVMEGDYADTPEGQTNYTQNVMSIAQSVQETQDHDTVWALLSCKNYQKMWHQKFGEENVPYTRILADEIATFGSANTDSGTMRLRVLIEQHKHLMAIHGVTPDLLILAPGSRIHMTMTAPMETEYFRAGPDGVMKRERGPDALGNMQGLHVFEARDFSVHTKSVPIQLLTRPIQIAEFYPITFDRLDEACHSYSSKEMGTVVYDENDDQWRRITLNDAFRHTMIFDGQGSYSTNVARYVQTLNAERRSPAALDGHNADQATKPTFFLVAPNASSEWQAIRHFGQMEPQHMTPLHVQRIAESLAGKLAAGAAGERLSRWNDFMTLMSDLQSQGYNQTYWAALIGANARTSVGTDGRFVGELTPKGLADAWGVGQQLQWTPNEYGSLALPQGEAMRAIGIPAGYANVPGLRTLAAEAGKTTSPWRSVGLRARDAITMLQTMLDTMKMIFPSSTAVDPLMRAPWFHRPDALTAFVDSVFGVPADPLFIANLPIVSGSGASAPAGGAAAAAAAAAAGESLPWFVLPGSVFDIPKGMVVTDTTGDALVAAMRAGTPEFSQLVPVNPELATGMVAIKMPGGGMVNVPATAFNDVLQYTPELRALGLMPDGDSAAAKNVRYAFINIMSNGMTNAQERADFADFVYGYGAFDRVRLWRVIAGMVVSIDTDSMPEVVKTIHLKDGASPAMSAAAQRQIDELISGVDEADFAGLGQLTETWRPLFASAAAQPGAFGYASIADGAQRILDIERELLGMAADNPAKVAARTAYETGDALTVATAQAFGVMTGRTGISATRFAELKAELLTLAGRVDGVLRQTGASVPAAQRAAADRARTMDGGAMHGGAVVVADDPVSTAGAAYYRSPLSSSRAFLESLSSLFAGATAKPLAIPSDATSAHAIPYAWHGDAHAASIPLGAAMSAATGRAAYRNMVELFGTAAHPISETPMMQQYSMAADARVTLNEAPTLDARYASFEDVARTGAGIADSDDEAEELSMLSAQGAFRPAASMLSATMDAKRPRTLGAPMFGADAAAGASEGAGAGAGAGAAGHSGSGIAQRALNSLLTGAMTMRWQHTSEITDPLTRAAARVFLLARADKESTWKSMIENDIIIPMNIILTRPLIVHKMSSAIMMKGGLQTGANFFGGANVSRSVDGVSKRIYYNFTFRSKAVVTREKNVSILENLKFEGYLGGHNTQFIRNRRDFESRRQDRPSLLALATGINNARFGAHLDLTGRHSIAEANPDTTATTTVQYDSSEFYDGHVWKLSTNETSFAGMTRSSFTERGQRITTLATQGAQFRFNRATGRYSNFVEPQGHLKRDMARPGGRDVMAGIDGTFKPYDYHTVSM